MYQRALTKREIVEENALLIYSVYAAMVIANWMFSADALIFIRNFLISAGILGSSFWLNLSYFTSALRRLQADNTIAEIKSSNRINYFDIMTFNEFEQLYIDELKAEVDKLCEISEGNEEIKKLLAKRNIQQIMDNLSVKRRVRKK